jgi:hypothetical protein
LLLGVGERNGILAMIPSVPGSIDGTRRTRRGRRSSWWRRNSSGWLVQVGRR